MTVQNILGQDDQEAVFTGNQAASDRKKRASSNVISLPKRCFFHLPAICFLSPFCSMLSSAFQNFSEAFPDTESKTGTPPLPFSNTQYHLTCSISTWLSVNYHFQRQNNGSPRDIYILRPGIFKYTLYGKCVFANVIKLRTFSWGNHSRLSKWTLNAITCIKRRQREI